MLDGALESVLKQRGATVDRAKVVAAAKRLLKREPLTFNALRDELAERFPDTEIRSLGYTVRMQVPLLMLPTDDRWSFASDSRFTLAEAWLGTTAAEAGPRGARAAPPRRVRPGDRRRRPELVGREGAQGHGRGTWRTSSPRSSSAAARSTTCPTLRAPIPETPAPPRLLPGVRQPAARPPGPDAGDRRRAPQGARDEEPAVAATFLVDGVVAGSWAVERKGKAATLTLSSFGRLRKADKDALAAEAEALARFSGDGDPRIAFAQR